MNPLVQPDPGLFIWTIVTFLVLLTLLSKFAWTPLLTALQDRISQSLDEAKRAQDDTERLRREAAEIVRQAHVEANTIVSSSRADAERLREEAKQKARTEAAAILAAAERQIQSETARAR